MRERERERVESGEMFCLVGSIFKGVLPVRIQ